MTIRPSRSSSRWRAALGVALIVVIVASCFATQATITTASPAPVPIIPGFWKGLWHGFIAPIAFVVSLFSDAVRIYALPNAGRWYDFGFMLGIGGFSGGIFAGSRRPPRVRR